MCFDLTHAPVATAARAAATGLVSMSTRPDLVLPLRIGSTDVYVTPNLRQILRVALLNRTYQQVYFCYRCCRKNEPLIR